MRFGNWRRDAGSDFFCVCGSRFSLTRWLRLSVASFWLGGLPRHLWFTSINYGVAVFSSLDLPGLACFGSFCLFFCSWRSLTHSVFQPSHRLLDYSYALVFGFFGTEGSHTVDQGRKMDRDMLMCYGCSFRSRFGLQLTSGRKCLQEKIKKRPSNLGLLRCSSLKAGGRINQGKKHF